MLVVWLGFVFSSFRQRFLRTGITDLKPQRQPLRRNPWLSSFSLAGIRATTQSCPRRHLKRWHWMNFSRRLICFSLAIAISFAASPVFSTEDDLAGIKEQITKQHDEGVKRLHDWIAQVSIAAENRGYPEGADYMI